MCIRVTSFLVFGEEKRCAWHFLLTLPAAHDRFAQRRKAPQSHLACLDGHDPHFPSIFHKHTKRIQIHQGIMSLDRKHIHMQSNKHTQNHQRLLPNMIRFIYLFIFFIFIFFTIVAVFVSFMCTRYCVCFDARKHVHRRKHMTQR